MVPTLALLALSVPGIPGTLIGAEKIGGLDLSKVTTEVKRQFGRAEMSPEPITGIEFYKVKYWSVDPQGAPVALSGLVTLPGQTKTKGLVVFYHGTTADRRNVPSEMATDGKRSPDTFLAALAFSGGNYAMAAPDYLGLGAHKGVHPYAQSVNASAGKDLILAARTFAASKAYSLNNKLFVTGYSEGGGIAMWSSRKLWAESDHRLHPTASAPLAGPYDLSETMAKTIIKRARNPVETAVRLFFMSYFAIGLPPEMNVTLDGLFVPSFASYVPRAFELGGTDGDIGKRLANKALQVGGLLGIERVVQGDMRKAIREQDPQNSLVQMLRSNDCYDWQPRGPLYLVGLVQDGVVPFANTRRAVSAMRGLGVSMNVLNFHAITTSKMDHGSAVAPSLALALAFFNGGFAAVPKDPDPAK